MTAPPDVRDPRIDELFARFSEQPGDADVFESLESELRAAGRFLHLAGAYEVRLQSVTDASGRAELLLALASILDRHLDAPKAALRRLKDARALAPQHAEVLASLRRLLTRQRDVMAALQISEDEERLELSPEHRLHLCVETAELWTALGEESQARARLEEALTLQPDCEAARERLQALDGAGTPPEETSERPGADVTAASPAPNEADSAPNGASSTAAAAELPGQPAPIAESPARVGEDAVPSRAAPVRPRDPDARPSHAPAPVEAPQVEAESVATPPLEIARAEADPIEAETLDVAPAETEPVEAEPAEVEAPDVAPTDAKPVEEAPLEVARPAEPDPVGPRRIDAVAPVEEPLSSDTDTTAAEGSGEPARSTTPIDAAGPVDAAGPLERKAETCARDGDLPGWIDALEQLDALQGPSRDRAVQLAELHELQGDAARAAEVLEAWLAHAGDEPALLFALDRSYRRLGRPEARRAVLERHTVVRRSAEEGARLQTTLGELLERELDDPAAAENAFRAALELTPEDETVLGQLESRLCGADRADAWIDLLAGSARALGSGPLAADRFCRAAEAARARSTADPEAARALFVEALRAQGDPAPAIAGLRGLAQAGDRIAAREACQAELGLEPAPERRAELLGELMHTHRALGDLNAAREAGLRWADAAPGPDPMRALAEVGQETGTIDHEHAALEGLEAWLGDGEDRARVRTRLGELCEHLSPDAVDDAARWYCRALELDATGAARGRLADLYRRTGRRDDLAGLLQREIEAGLPEDPVAARSELASLLEERGDAARAAQVLLPAFLADPSADPIAVRLEELLQREDDLETLVSVLDQRTTRARTAETRRAAAVRLASLYLDRLGRPEDALESLRPHVEPQRSSESESLYERALLACANPTLQLEWWSRVQEHKTDPEERVELLMRLARVHHDADQLGDAIECLEEAEDLLPERDRDLARRPLLALLDHAPDATDPGATRRLELLQSLGQAARTARARAAFVLERARIRLDAGDAGAAMRELDQLPTTVQLHPREWRLVCDLALRADDRARYRSALETLIELTRDDAERPLLQLELADLYLGEDDAGHDPEAGEALLRELVEHPAYHQAAAERLGELFIQTGRRRARAELLERRLQQPELCPRARRVITLQLAALRLEMGEPSDAVRVLRTERELGGPHREVDRLLCEALGAIGEETWRGSIFRERSLTETGMERVHWLRAWLVALETARAPADQRLEVLERWLAFVGSDADLERRRIGLLRDAGRLDALAHALEDLLATDATLTPGRQVAIIRELLRIYEGALAAPQRALALCERELSRHPFLRSDAARLAASLDRPEQEVLHLEALLGEAPEDPRAPGWNRQLGLLLARTGSQDRAVERLRAALAHAPRDRDVLRALEPIERGSLTPAKLLRLLEARYPLESSEHQAGLAREAFTLSDQLCDAVTALAWARRWQAVDTLPLDALKRWLSLERAVGDPAGALRALGVLVERTQDGEMRARLLAEQAELFEERGEIRFACVAYREAIELAPRRSLRWLISLERLLGRRGAIDEQLTLLEQVAQHPDASAADAADATQRRIQLLSSQPDRQEQAAVELRDLLERDGGGGREARIERLRRLLSLCDQLGDTALWCTTAEQLVPLCEPDESDRIRRQLARRWEKLAARDRAVAVWQGLLAEHAADLEALEALVALLDRSGEEESRARVLEAWARATSSDSGPLWLEAAKLRWGKLGDAQGALTDVRRALELDSLAFDLHVLRVELCAHLGIPDEEEDSLRVLLEAQPCADRAPSRWLRLTDLVHQRGARPAELQEILDRALRSTEPGDGLRREVRVWLSRLGKWDPVADLLREEVSARGPELESALRELARVEWEERARPEPACAAYEQLASEHPLSPEDEDRWAEALRALGRDEDSIPHRARALEGLADRARSNDWLELAQDLLEHAHDVAAARDAARRALDMDATCEAALELRVRLDQELGRHSDELEGRVALGAMRGDSGDAALELARAARLALDANDLDHAQAICAQALEHDPSCLPALWCTAELAVRREDWAGSERAHDHLAHLIEEPAEDRGRAARHAAHAARLLDRTAAASHFLEVALDASPKDATALGELLTLSLELGHLERARDCLRMQLDRLKLSPEDKASTRLALAEIQAQVGDADAALGTLEAVCDGAPDLEAASRERLVDLLEKLGDSERAVEQLDAWAGAAGPTRAPELALRAARLESAAGQHEEARARLERLVATTPERADAWIELAQLCAHHVGPQEALSASERALAHLTHSAELAELHWCRSEWWTALAEDRHALVSATEALALDPAHAEAASRVARAVESAGGARRDDDASDTEDVWDLCVPSLQRAAYEGGLPPSLLADVWSALGSAHALRDQRLAACDAYRSALESNPLHAHAHERLADLTAYEPSTQHESVRLHQALLEKDVARPASWRALADIAERLSRPRPLHTCHAVLHTLGLASSDPPAGKPLLVSNAAARPELEASTALLIALAELGLIPELAHDPSQTDLGVLDQPLRALSGGAFWLDDTRLDALTRQSAEELEERLSTTPRLKRRRARKAHKALCETSPAPATECRTELLVQAATGEILAGRLDLSAALAALFHACEATRTLDLEVPERRLAAVPLCPAAQSLLRRIALAVTSALPS